MKLILGMEIENCGECPFSYVVSFNDLYTWMCKQHGPWMIYQTPRFDERPYYISDSCKFPDV